MSLLQNPFFSAGMNILAANKGSQLQPIGQGVIGAQQQIQHNQLLQQRQQLEQEQQETLRKYRELQTRQLEYEMNKPPERKFIKDAMGRTRDANTLELAIPDEQIPAQTEIGKLHADQAPYPVGSAMWNYFEQRKRALANNDLPPGMFRGEDGQARYMEEYIAGQQRIKDAGRSQTNVNVNTGPSLSPGQEALDKKFATDIYSPYVLGGSSADASKNLRQLEWVHDQLTSGASLTGPIVGATPDFINTFVNPGAINTREAAEEVVQRNLREILGPQFTEKEGERLISRAYNPRLSEEINVQRISRLIESMRAAATAKQDTIKYFEENGTIQGFRGKLPSIDDFYAVLDAPDSEGEGASNQIDDLVNKYGN